MGSRYKKSIKNSKKIAAIAISLILLISVLGIGSIVYVNKLLDTNTFYDGITIDGISMNGLTKDSAEEVLKEKNQFRLDNLNIKLVHQSKSWELRYNDMKAFLDIREKIDRAYNIGREGNILDRYLTVQKLRKQGYSVNTELSYNVNSIVGNIEGIASEINKDPVDATVIFSPDDKIKFNITPEKEGSSLDVGKVIEKIEEVLEKGTSDNVIELSPDRVPAKVSVKDFEGKLDKVVTFGTDLSKSAEDRTNNIVTAALAFNGMIVPPNQVVSFNQTTGERTIEKGYKNAPMIQNKRFVDVPGGGVSQTSTTLYNTVIRAGLEVIERTRHSLPSSYIAMGLDTTVNLPPPEPTIDLKFRNNRNSPIYIRAFYANKKIYFEIYGQPLPNGQKYEFYSKVYETIPAPTPDIVKDNEGKYVKYEGEEYIYAESRKGYKVRVYRQTFENGNLIEEELFDTHFYRPVKGKVYVGVEKRDT